MSNYHRDFLIEEHLDLAREIGLKEWRTATHALDKDEMVALAYMGLVDAATRWEAYCEKNEYSPEATQFFKVFARLRIRGTIRDNIRSADWATRTMRTKSKRLKDAGQDDGLSVQVLAERTGMTVTEINKVIARLSARPISLDAYMSNDRVNSDNSPTSGTELKDDIDTEGAAFAKDMVNVFISTLRGQPAEIQVVMVLHYYSKLDLKRVAEELNIPETKVSQLHSSGVTAVKSALVSAAQERD